MNVMKVDRIAPSSLRFESKTAKSGDIRMVLAVIKVSQISQKVKQLNSCMLSQGKTIYITANVSYTTHLRCI